MGWIAKAQGSGIFSAAIMGTTAVVLASTLLTTVTHLRMHELRDSLLASNEKADELRNLTLLSRVSMINQRAMAGGRENAAAYKQEAESALIAIRQSRAQGREVPLLDRATIPILNGFNWLMGLPRLHLGKTPERELVLDLAFQFESYREYAKAIRGYDVYINEFRLDAQESDFALLHRGFCRAMVSQFDAALADFDAVANHSISENADVARKLAVFLKELKARIQYIESIQDPAQRGELYYNAAAYIKAIENFSQVDKNRQTDKIRFLTARALEETGNTKQALPIYRTLVASGAASQYAVNANRRMYLLGTFLGNDQDLARESKKNSETVVKDKEFMSTVTHLEKSATKLQAEAAREQSEKSDELAAVHKLVLPEEPVPVAAPVKQGVPATPEPVTPPPAAPIAPPAPKPKPAAELNLRNEKVAERAEKLGEEKKQQLLKKQAEKIDKLTMADGNVFFGVIYKEDADHVFLYSVLGNLELEKSNILKRERVEGTQALK
ncbi:MAG: hypothetical protein U1F27_15205 [Turneriella sp.]